MKRWAALPVNGRIAANYLKIRAFAPAAAYVKPLRGNI
jgi:hypothetical protein